MTDYISELLSSILAVLFFFIVSAFVFMVWAVVQFIKMANEENENVLDNEGY